MKTRTLIGTSILRSLVAPAAMALAAMGLASTAQADTKLLAVEFGPTGQNLQGVSWSAFTSATNPPVSQVFGAYTVSVATSGNTGFRNRGIPNPAVDAAWAKVIADNFFGANQVSVKITGLTPGSQYYVNVYNARETNNNSRNVHFKMSTTGTLTDPSATDIGWSHQRKTLPAGWVPVANTGIDQTQYGEGWLKTPVFTATATGAISIYTVGAVELDTGSGSAYSLNAFELYEVVPVTANAGVDKTVNPSAPSVQIGGSPTALGGTAPYTYLWSPSGSLDDATLANPTATLSAPGTTTYTVTVTDALSATSSDTVLVTFVAADDYDTWAAAYADSQAANLDYNKDGVQNGIAYFMGMNGFATNPGVVGGKIAWPYMNSVASYKVQTSNDLSPMGWTDVATNDPKLHDTGLGGSVTYDLLPAEQDRLFVRLVVTP